MSGRSRLLHFTKDSADGSGVGVTHSIGGDEMDVDFEAAAGAVEVAARMHGRGALVWCSSSSARRRWGRSRGGTEECGEEVTKVRKPTRCILRCGTHSVSAVGWFT